LTKENVYQYYLKWKKGKNIWEVNDLFKSPSINMNIYENEKILINRLFYLIPDFWKSKLRVLVFYEENIFIKENGGDLRLIRSDLNIQ
jgi:hypothetical protein